MSKEFEYDLSDALAYIRARVRESQQEYDALVADSTHTHDSIDSGSLHSQSSASAYCLSRSVSVCSSQRAQSRNDLASSYQKTIAELHADMFLDGSQQHMRDDEATSPDPSSLEPRCDGVRSEDVPAISTSTPFEPRRKSSFELETKPERILTPTHHTKPQLRSSTFPRSVRFEEHLAGPPPMTMDLSKADEQQLLRKSSSFENLPKTSRLVSSLRRTLSLRRTKSIDHSFASSIHSVPASGRSRTDSVLQRDRTDTA